MDKKRIWVVVADGSEARILFYAHDSSKLSQLPSGEFHDFDPPTRDLVTDRPSRVHESAGPASHGIELRSDPHRQYKEKFIDRLIHYLEDAAKRDEFDRFIVVAPAKALSVFRKDYSEQLKRRLKCELVHDYVHQTSEYIHEHIRDHM